MRGARSSIRPGCRPTLGPTMNAVDTALSEFTQQDITVKIAQAILRTLPFAPEQPDYHNVDGALAALYPQGGPEVRQRAHQLADSESIGKVLWTAKAIDAGDT